MLYKLWIVSSVTFLFISHVNTARILAVVPIASLSHQVVFQPIWKQLSLKGHQVTVLTSDPLRDPSLINLTEIDMGFLYELMKQYLNDVSQGLSHWELVRHMVPTLETLIPKILGSQEMLSVINDNTSTYDVVLAEVLLPVTYAFAAKFRCPLIGISSLGVTTKTHEALGNPRHPVLDSDLYIPYFGRDLTFFQKFERVLFNIYEKYLYDYLYYPTMDRFLKIHFGDNIPQLYDIERNMSLLMLNTNPIIHGPQLYGANVVEFGGGVHLKPKKPLPLDLKAFLDSATEGVIYFNLGGNIKSMYLPGSKKKILINTFAKLPYKVLWKFEDDHLEGKPKNVRIEKWLPQQDVLSHPNMKLFITQGGLQSLEEALFDGVPLLALPFMADQHINAKRIQKLGIGLCLDFSTLSEESFSSSIIQIVKNPKYKDKTVEIQRLLKDQPTDGVEKVMWWTEYVIRNKGAPYLRNPRVDVTWSEFLVLDVVAFLLFVLAGSLFVFYKVVRFVTYLSFTRAHPRKNKVH